MALDGSHLHNLFFYDDYMTPVKEGSTNLNSLLVYTILSESGWYNLQHEEELQMGNWLQGGIGCEILEKNCYDLYLESKYGIPTECLKREKRSWMSPESWNPLARRPKCLVRKMVPSSNHLAEHYFCFDESDPTCDISRFQSTQVPEHFQYFKYPNLGGSMGLIMEYCTVNKRWRENLPPSLEIPSSREEKKK